MFKPRFGNLQITIIFIATLATMTGANGQKVYKCAGNVYSQTPCTESVAIDPTDNRTAEQKAQADVNTVRTRAAADQMERDRLTQEREALASQDPPKKHAKPSKRRASAPAASNAIETLTAKQAKKKKHPKTEPEFFTAKSAPAAKADPAKK